MSALDIYNLAVTPSVSIPKLQTKKRDWRAGLFDKLSPGNEDLSDEDRAKLGRQSLLHMGLAMLNQGGRGFGGDVAAGLQSGLLAANYGVEGLQQGRQAQAEKQRAAQIEELAGQAFANGQVNPEAFQRLAVLDPNRAKTLQSVLGENPGEQYTLTPGAMRFDARGRLIASAPTAPKMHLIEGEDGYAFVPEPGTGGGMLGDAPMMAGNSAPTGGLLGNQGMPQGGTESLLGGALHDAVMHVESRGNPLAVSPKGAMGTMQTMPGTLRDPGFGVMPARDGSHAEMERVGKNYLDAMVSQYGPIGGLAAYNWGPGNWQNALAKAGGDPQRALSMAPKETRDYVPKVLSRVQGGGAGSGMAAGGMPGVIPVPGIRPKKKGGATFAPLTQDEIIAEGLPPGTVAQRNLDTNELKIIRTPPAAPAPKKPEMLSGEAANKVGLYDNAIRAAIKWHEQVARKGPDGKYTGDYNDMAARMPAAQALLQQALRAKLRAESGASISEAEIEGEISRYMGGLMGSDGTNLQKANALLQDLVTQRKLLVGGRSLGGSPPAGAAPPRNGLSAEGAAALSKYGN